MRESRTGMKLMERIGGEGKVNIGKGVEKESRKGKWERGKEGEKGKGVKGVSQATKARFRKETTK